MSDLRQEVISKLNELRQSAARGEVSTSIDLKILLLASLMEEEGRGSNKK